jgi:hypothetical protein
MDWRLLFRNTERGFTLLDGVYDTKLESGCQAWTDRLTNHLPSDGGALRARIGATM